MGHQIGDAAGWIVGVGGALGVLVWVGRIVLSTWRKLGHFLEDWNGEPARPGNNGGRAGVMSRLEAIEHQLTPNSGTSLYDKVQQIADKQEDR